MSFVDFRGSFVRGFVRHNRQWHSTSKRFGPGARPDRHTTRRHRPDLSVGKIPPGIPAGEPDDSDAPATPPAAAKAQPTMALDSAPHVDGIDAETLARLAKGEAV